jgi:hypothetical protein
MKKLFTLATLGLGLMVLPANSVDITVEQYGEMLDDYLANIKNTNIYNLDAGVMATEKVTIKKTLMQYNTITDKDTKAYTCNFSYTVRRIIIQARVDACDSFYEYVETPEITLKVGTPAGCLELVPPAGIKVVHRTMALPGGLDIINQYLNVDGVSVGGKWKWKGAAFSFNTPVVLTELESGNFWIEKGSMDFSKNILSLDSRETTSVFTEVNHDNSDIYDSHVIVRTSKASAGKQLPRTGMKFDIKTGLPMSVDALDLSDVSYCEESENDEDCTAGQNATSLLSTL